MPANGSYISMVSLTTPQYAALDTVDANAIYWLSDVHQVYVGSQLYAGAVEFSPDLSFTDITNPGLNKLYVNTTTYEAKVHNGTNWNVVSPAIVTDVDDIPEEGTVLLSASALMTYLTSELTYTNSEPSAVACGGIAVGSTFDNKSIKEMLDMMLYPELFPTLTAPSCSSFTDNYSPTTVEVGTTAASITFTTGFSRGSISPAYGTSGYRSGLPTAYVYTGEQLAGTYESTALTDSQTITDMTFSARQTYTWTAKVSYSAGETPLSSYGETYTDGTALAAGTTSTKSLSINAYYAYYANTSDIDTMTKQTIGNTTTSTPAGMSSSMSYYSVALVSETGDAGDDTGKHSIEIVASTPVTAVLLLNTLSNQYEYLNGSAASSLACFTTSSITKQDAGGNDVTYTKYTHNQAQAGSRTYLFVI